MSMDLGPEVLLSRPFLPSLGWASAVLLLVSLLLLLIRSRSSSNDKSELGDDKANGHQDSLLNGNAVEEQPKPRVLLLYGTQTGTAERFAKQLRNEMAARYGDTTNFETLDIEEYNAEELLQSEQLVFFLMATYGDGEPTDNAADCFNWLIAAADSANNGDGEQILQGVQYGVFGLGNKQYEHFCAVGKRIHKSLKALGAAPVVRLGEGDDDDDIEADFEGWRHDLLAALDKSPLVTNNEAGGASALTALTVPAYTVEVVTGAAARAPRASLDRRGAGTSHASPFPATISAKRELHTPESERSCLHVELNVGGSQISYAAGDHIALYAENSPAIVEETARLLGLPLDTVFRLGMPEGNAAQLSTPFSGPISLRDALAKYADVLAPARKDQLEALAVFATEPADAARLQQLLSLEGAREYKEWVAECHRSLLEVMQAFPSAKPPLGAFFASIAPRLQPRFYSISSSPAQHPATIHVTCAVVQDVTATGRQHHGICSSWLARAAVGQQIPVYVRSSAFKLPKQVSTPIVMVGPGTGLAPFRGFLQERSASQASGAALGPALLFFGCRNSAHDYIYQGELEAYRDAGVIEELFCAFSREGPQKDYVQHHMAAAGKKLWRLLEAGGHFYVCGDAKKMAKDVNASLLDIVQRCNSCSREEAEAVVKGLIDNGRYQRDVW